MTRWLCLWPLVMAGCAWTPIEVEGLACTDALPCPGTYDCVSGHCRAHDDPVADAGVDAGVPICKRWFTNAEFCVDFDDYGLSPWWTKSSGAVLTVGTYPDPLGATGSVTIHSADGASYGFIRSPALAFGPSDARFVRATMSYVLGTGAHAVEFLQLDLSPAHGLTLSYDGAGSGVLDEHLPDGGVVTLSTIPLDASDGSHWVQLVADFHGDAGVWLGSGQDWDNLSTHVLLPIEPQRSQAAGSFGIVRAPMAADLILDIAVLEVRP